MAGVIIVGVRSFDDIIGRYFRSVDDRLPRPCAGVALILGYRLLTLHRPLTRAFPQTRLRLGEGSGEGHKKMKIHV